MVDVGKKQRFTWLFNRMYKLAEENGLELQLADTWAHSLRVWSIACELLEELLPKNIAIDVDFIEFACFTHDLGRLVTGSLASEIKDPNHGFKHGPIGAAIIREQGFFQRCPTFPTRYPEQGALEEALARICERHTGCVGISKANYLRCQLPYEPKWNEIAGKKGVFVSTLEEKTVGIVDFVTKAMQVYPAQGTGQNLFYQGRAIPIQQRLNETKNWDTFPVIREIVREMQDLAPNFLSVNWDDFH